MNNVDWLIGEIGLNEDVVYRVDKIPKDLKVIRLKRQGAIVFNLRDDLWVKFAVCSLAFTQDNIDYLSLVFQGEGPSDNLRELRHTYWGEDGYIFYVNGIEITEAFAHLAEYFDECKEESK